MTTFTTETHYNPYLDEGGTDVHAIVRVEASGSGASGAVVGDPPAAEVIIIDVSGSMGGKTRKLIEAKKAAAAAIDCLRDGVRFGVIAGHEEAFQVFPEAGPLPAATAAARAEAKKAVDDVWAGGGTAIGQWLLAANALFPDDPGMIRHAILLTDGQNQNETAGQLQLALNRCEGRFECDCRGVGTDWEVSELQTIASRLLGSVDLVAEPAGLEADFRSMMERSMAKATADVRLRVWTPAGATVAYVGRASGDLVDLTDRRMVVSDLIGDYPTGAWGDEIRDYHVHLRFPARALGEEMLAARIGLMVDHDKVGEALLQVQWTDNMQLSTKAVALLAKYQHEEESSRLTREGLAAMKEGDEETATHKLTLGLRSAEEAGNETQAANIRKLLDVAPDGTVRIRRGATEAEVKQTEIGTGKTDRIPRADPS